MSFTHISPQLLDMPAQTSRLDEGLKREMESLFCHGFDEVRIHQGPHPALIGAEAFVCGADIYMTPGKYAPETPAGKRLLIHELTHVVQQQNLRAGNRQAGIVLWSDPDSESEAELRANGIACPIHAVPEAAGLVIQRSVLRRDNKQALHGAVEDLVKQVPIAHAYNAEIYSDEMLEWIRTHPHVFSGEKYEFDGMKNQSAKIPVVIRSGQRISISMFDHNDWKWLRKTILKLAGKHRYGRDFTEITTRILDEDDNQWVAWKTSDCVFTAILIVLGLRFQGQGKPVEDYELEVETTLAEQLQIPKKVVQDHVLVSLLEDRLGWRRMQVTDLETLNAQAASGRSYVVSYCENDSTDFWHTVYGSCTGKSQWKWVDRQYERNFGTIRASLKGDPATEANAWEIDSNSALVRDLRTRIGIDALKTRFKDHIA